MNGDGGKDWVDWDELLKDRRDKKWESFSWLTVRALVSTVNDVIGKGAPRLVNDLRGGWMAEQRKVPSGGRWTDDLVVELPAATSFIVLGDPGEQDASQYAVVPVLLSQRANFMVICSDVIYPSGDVNDYVDGFYIPYRDLQLPIYALPGNHDWYDGLSGFMWHFCGAEALNRSEYLATSYSVSERIARALWRPGSAPKRDVLAAYRNSRAPQGEPWRPLQPGPYYAIETADLLVVCIDSGITGEIDREQADWLVRVSHASAKPKVLLTGKPLVVNNRHDPGRFPVIDGHPVSAATPDGDEAVFSTVDDVVRHEPFGYVAAIGGDIHNYQHYDVVLDGTRPFHYVVSGGGGAYMSATHPIPAGEPLGFDTDPIGGTPDIKVKNFNCYPTRLDSLSYFSELFVPLLVQIVLAVTLAMLGLALAVLLVLVADVGDRTLEIVAAAAAGAVAARTLLVVFKIGGQRPLGYATSFVTGVAIGLGGWWVSPGRFGTNVTAAAALAAAGAVIALALRWAKIWKQPRWLQAAVVVAQLLGALAALYLWLVPERGHSVLVAIVATLAAPVAVLLGNLVIRAAAQWIFSAVAGLDRRRARAALRSLSPAITVGLITGVTLALVYFLHGPEVTRGVLAALAAGILPLAAVLLVDYARRVSPDGYKPMLLATLVVLVALAVPVLRGENAWIPRAAVGATVVVAILGIGVMFAHLTYLNALSLLWHWNMHDGSLDAEQARAALDWRADDHSRPSSARTRRIANMVFPEARSAHGPLHKFVSEICDRDSAPFRKNFLRLEVAGGQLKITCFHATGEERSSDHVTREEPISIDLGVRG